MLTESKHLSSDRNREHNEVENLEQAEVRVRPARHEESTDVEEES